MKCKICNKETELWYKDLYDDRHGYPGYFDIARCVNCGFAQTRPQLRKSKIAKLYKDYYPRKKLNLANIKRSNYKNPDRFKLWRKGLLSGCQFWVKPGSTVLDVGSGLGYGLLWLEGMGCKAYGIDPDKNAQKVANKFNLNFHLGFIEDNPFEGERFDFVIANQTLEHTNEPIKFLIKCKKRLKTDGKLIFSFPSTSSLSQRILGKNWLHWHIPYHLNHFNKKSVLIAAEKSGLKVEKIATITPNQWTNIQIRQLISKPEMGERDEFWDFGKSEKAGEFINTSLFKKVASALEEYNLFNRLVDTVGLGDCFVVILK